jgi:hypothetical protein
LKGLRKQYGSCVWRFALCVSLFVLLWSDPIRAQDQAEYEEISVFLMVQRVGGIEIPAVYYQQQIYLPVQVVFDFLKIRCIPSPGNDSVSGFFINTKDTYVIDKLHNRIVFGNRTYTLKPDDLVRTETNLYLRSNFFGEIFGLDCTFNFRSLSVNLNTKIELPVIRDMRLEFMRSNISRMKGEVIADTVIPKSSPLFRFGMADWSVISNQELNGVNQTRLNLGLGSVVAGGELNVALQHYVNQPFEEKQQHYLWRFVNNNHKALRQVTAGKIAGQSTSSIYNPIIGMQFTNAPTTYRRSFGKYTLTDYTEPDWSVELYVNNVLVDYVKADANGFFTFEVPLMYGSTIVLLRFYGPFGEEQSRQQTISVPYNFLPAKEFQYTVSGGMVEDSLHSLFSRANANYGVGKFMTVGGGMEYLSSVSSGSIMPFVNTSLRLGSNVLFSGEYTYGVRGKGILNYRTAKNFQVELNYTRYDPNQTAISFNYLEERRAMVSFPIRRKGFNAYSRISLAQNILPATRYSTAEWLLSGVILGVSTNFTTYALFPDLADPYVYSNLSLGLRLPGKFIFRPQAQFVYTGGEFMLVKADLEKQILKHGFLNLSFENNFKTDVRNIQLGFRYDFSFAQTAFSYRNGSNISTFMESARGSLVFDGKTKYTGASNRTSVGRGGIVLLPFLDLNGNSLRDPGESRVVGLKININGGRVEYNKQDSVIRIFDLEPYVSYFIELDRFSFDNIAWQMKLKNISVLVDPNQFKLVEIPISVMSEAAGMVNLTGPGGDKGLGRITVEFYKSSGVFFAKTLSEPDGYFSLLAFPPGDYIARIDTAQVRKLNMTVTPASIPFTMDRSANGDVKDGLEFTLRYNQPAKPMVVEPENKKAVVNDINKKEETKKDSEPKVSIPAAMEPSSGVVYCIQLSASRTFLKPESLKSKHNLEEEVFYYQKDGWYKYVVGKFSTKEQAAGRLATLGIPGFITAVDRSFLKRD